LGHFRPEYLPTRRGFDHQYGHYNGAIDYFKLERDGGADWHRDDKVCRDEGYSTSLIAREAERLIKEQPKDKPLFLYVPFNAVHSPFQVPAIYCQPYANLQGDRRNYAGMLAAMDEAIGQVLTALDEKKMRDNTLIIFSSDNGGPAPGKVTSNGPLRAGKGTLYEGGIRVCACVNWPGHIPAGKVINEPLHAVDWYPTLVKLAGAPPDQKLPLDGLDIWPVLTQGAKSPHDALLLCGMRAGQAAIRRGDWKLLVGAGDKSGGPAALYNLASDIGEQTNLAADKPDMVKELQGKLDAFLKSAVPSGEGSVSIK
jgi:arylsulfatase A-like enzyme